MNPLASIRRSMLAAAIVSITALVAASTVQAAVITWGAATNIAGDTDVSTNGSLVGAINLGPSTVTNTTINGVNFTGVNLTGNNVTSGNFNLTIATAFNATTITSPNAPYTTKSASYRALLSTIGGDFQNPITLTMSGLTVGNTYEFEFWSNNSNGFNSPLTATAGNAVTLSSNTTGLDGGVGQFAIGTFIADNASQQIVFTTTNQSFLNGFQLRQTAAVGTAVPEPGSALVGMMVLGLCGTRLGRRQRA